MLGSSENSSGCESGWTLYLDHSVSSPNPSRFREITNGFGDKRSKSRKHWGKYHYTDEDGDEDDLSMVSDASSGPRNLAEDEACDYSNGFKRETAKKISVRPQKQSKREKKGREDPKMASFLDDTASSPFFNFPNSNVGVNHMEQGSLESALDYSQGFSATHFQGAPAFQEQYGFLQSSLSGNQIQNNQWF
ncbi:PREDICTED: uncharacterized protein LOC104807210 [Tarenaya hassleriana]|uniref:uncharacterized protein LOC104807210 n=1 Tax=Tarenaya hassleriana TaxID=28532 RepID=UPI00053C9549|nr:PREDICTED: uncharacterized protein LOC104807210 [Tarenaya hassleriana]